MNVARCGKGACKGRRGGVTNGDTKEPRSGTNPRRLSTQISVPADDGHGGTRGQKATAQLNASLSRQINF
jgi:hypothetical protein